jgi:hypothetical protein
MHELVGSQCDSCGGETRTSEHIGITPEEEGWTVGNDNEMLVAALTCYAF